MRFHKQNILHECSNGFDVVRFSKSARIERFFLFRLENFPSFLQSFTMLCKSQRIRGDCSFDFLRKPKRKNSKFDSTNFLLNDRKLLFSAIFSIFCNGEDFDAARTKSFLNECDEQLGENSINFSKIQNEQDFSQFIENLPKDSCRIVDWLLDENLLEKISKRNVQKPFDRDTVYAAALKSQSRRKNRRVSTKKLFFFLVKPEEIRNFRRIFEDLLLQNNSRYLTEFDAETFQRIFQPFFTAALSERIFSVFDENRDGSTKNYFFFSCLERNFFFKASSISRSLFSPFEL